MLGKREWYSICVHFGPLSDFPLLLPFAPALGLELGRTPARRSLGCHLKLWTCRLGPWIEASINPCQLLSIDGKLEGILETT